MSVLQPGIKAGWNDISVIVYKLTDDKVKSAY